ncbi:MAG: restriction endonuclease, partial [Thermoguttaceae bacterium]
MSELHKILDEIKAASANLSKKDKGTRFEQLILQFLKHDSAYSEPYKNVWLWQDFPLRDGKPDTGIDLVCELADGTGYAAVQCKFYSEETTLQKADIDSFLATSSKKPFVRRIIVSTTSHWSNNAIGVLKDIEPPVQIIGLSDLENSNIDWSQFSFEKSAKLKLR